MLGEGAYMATSERWLALLLDVCGQWEVGPCSAALGNMLNGLDLIVSVWRGDVFCFNAWLLSSSYSCTECALSIISDRFVDSTHYRVVAVFLYILSVSCRSIHQGHCRTRKI